jgi:hypothetical protein
LVGIVLFGGLVVLVGTVNPTLGQRMWALGPRRLLGLLFFGACEVYFLVQVVRGPELADRLSNLILLAVIGGLVAITWSRWAKPSQP